MYMPQFLYSFNQNHKEISPIRMAIIKKTTRFDNNSKKLESYILLVGMETSMATMENSVGFLQKIKKN